MNNKNLVGVHWSFWVIAVVTLIWNAMGGINFIMQMNPDSIASFPESHRAIIENRPTWATTGFGLAVFGGTLGCLLLLLRKSAAFYVFIASLLGVIVTMILALGFTRSVSNSGFFEIILVIVMPIVVTAFLVWYAKRAQRRGWIS